MYTVFDQISDPTLITGPHPDFLLYFHLLSPTWRSFPDFLLCFHLLSPTWRSFGISGREQIYLRLQATNSSARRDVSIEQSQGFQIVRCLIGC